MHTAAYLIAIQLPKREDRFNEPLLSDISIIVEELSSSIKNYLDKPFIFFGHSTVAIIAFELVRGMRRKEMNQPLHLIVSGAGDLRISLARENNHHLSDSEFIEGLKKYNGIPLSALENTELTNLFLSIIRADFSILKL